MSVVLIVAEIVRSSLPADVAVYALIVYIILARHIVFVSVLFHGDYNALLDLIRYGANQSPIWAHILTPKTEAGNSSEYIR